MNKIIKFGIIISLLGVWGCKQKTEQNNINKPVSEPTSNITESKIKKWDNLIDTKGPQGDSTGWYTSNTGAWIDTIREEKHKYNPWPPHDEGKTYYPNCTVHLLEDAEQIKDAEQDIKIYVKSLDQQHIKWIYPIKESKLFNNEQIQINKIIESGPRYQYTSINILGDSGASQKYSDVEDQMAIDIQQMGDVIISQISHYKIANYSDMVYAKTEVAVYDLNGDQLASIIRDGGIANTSVSENIKYLFQTYGGQITEDTKLISGASIYDIQKKEYWWKKESMKDCIGVGSYNQTNLAKISIISSCNKKNSQNTALIMNTVNGKTYKFISLTKCNPSRIRVSADSRIYFNSQQGKEFLSLESDFMEFEIINLN